MSTRLVTIATGSASFAAAAFIALWTAAEGSAAETSPRRSPLGPVTSQQPAPGTTPSIGGAGQGACPACGVPTSRAVRGVAPAR